MGVIRMTIPGRLAGANEVISAMNAHRFAGSTLKKKETHRCAQAAVASLVPEILRPVSIEFHWFEPNRRRDFDNIRYGAKFILDGLRLARKLPNDGWAWVMTLGPDKFFVDAKNPRIEVFISEI